MRIGADHARHADAFEIVNGNVDDSAKSAAYVNAAGGSGQCKTYDYAADLFGHHYLSYETSLSISGGTEATKYYVSGTTRNDGGTMLNTYSKR